MIKKTLLTISFTLIAFIGFAQKNKKNKKSEPVMVESMSGVDSASYSFGLKIAQGLKSDGVDSLSYEYLTKAMKDVFKGDSLKVSDADAGAVIGKFLQASQEKKFAKTKEESATFLEKNKSNPNIITLPSGLQYEVITQGTGNKPTASDEVTVHYKGTLVNGKQFDSSYDRNEPLSLPLNGVIKGWTEGVQLMPVGSKYRFYIPYTLGYGERGAGQDIPPYSTLIFDIELIKIGK